MFICGVCETVSKPGEKPVTVVTETRMVHHPHRIDANSNVVRAKDANGTYFRRIITDDPGGRGTQIVSEIRAHASCA